MYPPEKKNKALVQANQHSLYLTHPTNFNDDRSVAYRFADQGCRVPSAISQGRVNPVQSQRRGFPNESLLASHSKYTEPGTQPGQHQSHSLSKRLPWCHWGCFLMHLKAELLPPDTLLSMSSPPCVSLDVPQLLRAHCLKLCYRCSQPARPKGFLLLIASPWALQDGWGNAHPAPASCMRNQPRLFCHGRVVARLLIAVVAVLPGSRQLLEGWCEDLCDAACSLQFYFAILGQGFGAGRGGVLRKGKNKSTEVLPPSLFC